MQEQSEIDIADKLLKQIVQENSFWRRFWLITVRSKEYLISMSILLLAYHIWFLFDNTFSYSTIVWVAILSIVAFLFIVVSIELERKHSNINSSSSQKKFIGVLFNAILIVSIVIAIAKGQASSIKNNKLTYGVSITLDDDYVIVSDSTNYYIGKTKNYVFVHNEVRNSTCVIPMSRVKQMTIKKNIDERFKFY